MFYLLNFIPLLLTLAAPVAIVYVIILIQRITQSLERIANALEKPSPKNNEPI